MARQPDFEMHLKFYCLPNGNYESEITSTIQVEEWEKIRFLSKLVDALIERAYRPRARRFKVINGGLAQ
ncbi:MAG: hypothetical protein AB1500_07620 [Bacillota bacterium]